MQKTKYLMAVILFLVAFLLIGEFFIWRLYTFPSEYPPCSFVCWFTLLTTKTILLTAVSKMAA